MSRVKKLDSKDWLKRRQIQIGRLYASHRKPIQIGEEGYHIQSALSRRQKTGNCGISSKLTNVNLLLHCNVWGYSPDIDLCPSSSDHTPTLSTDYNAVTEYVTLFSSWFMFWIIPMVLRSGLSSKSYLFPAVFFAFHFRPLVRFWSDHALILVVTYQHCCSVHVELVENCTRQSGCYSIGDIRFGLFRHRFTACFSHHSYGEANGSRTSHSVGTDVSIHLTLAAGGAVKYCTLFSPVIIIKTLCWLPLLHCPLDSKAIDPGNVPSDRASCTLFYPPPSHLPSNTFAYLNCTFTLIPSASDEVRSTDLA